MKVLSLLIAMFSLSVAPVARADAPQRKYPVQIPVNEQTLFCYYGSLSLIWGSLPGVWEIQGEPGPYNSLSEKKWGWDGPSSCDKIPGLIRLADSNGGFLNGTLSLQVYPKELCYGGSYGGDRICRIETVREIQVDLPDNVIVYETEILPAASVLKSTAFADPAEFVSEFEGTGPDEEYFLHQLERKLDSQASAKCSELEWLFALRKSDYEVNKQLVTYDIYRFSIKAHYRCMGY